MKTPTNASNGTKVKKHAILLVDDHPLFRKGMTQLLDSQNDLQVEAEADNSGGALNAIRSKRFDLAVVDIGLRGGANGIELTKSIKAERPELPVLVVSMHDEALYAERALRAGARGYVMKREALDSILQAVRSVIGGEIYISPTMTKRMLFDHINGGGEARSRGRSPDRSRTGSLPTDRRRPRHARDRGRTAPEQKNRRSPPRQHQGKARGPERARSGALRDAVGHAAAVIVRPS